MRLISKHDATEIKSWIEFSSRNYSDEEQICPSSMKKEEESKESAYSVWERMKKRHTIFFNKQTFEEQILVKCIQFSDGVMSRLDQLDRILSQLMFVKNSTDTSL